MEKKLYWNLSDNADLHNLTMDLSGCMEYINGDIEMYDTEEEHKEVEYTLTPVYLTDDEFANLPEYEF